jgi:hypothetical protein
MWACATWVPQSVGKTWRQPPRFDAGVWLNDAFDLKMQGFVMDYRGFVWGKIKYVIGIGIQSFKGQPSIQVPKLV